MDCLGNKTDKIPKLQLRHFTVAIQNNNPLVGMRIIPQKLDD